MKFTSLIFMQWLLVETTGWPSNELSDIIGATHWAPCYYMNSSLPATLDGAVALAPLGTRTIKLSVDSPWSNYPWNSKWPTSFANVTAMVSHPYYADVLSNAQPGTSYSTFILVAYSTGPRTGMFCGTYDAEMETEDQLQFAELTLYLMTTYAGEGKTFVLQSWENDWAVRCGSYDPSVPPNHTVVANYQRWLQARQSGVTAGRIAACAKRWGSSRCAADDASSFMAAADVIVYHAAEVNLVYTSLMLGTQNLILSTIPRVSLDMVSYSSYDCMATALFGLCLDFIYAHHNRTRASPSPAIAVGEFGVPEIKAPPGTLQNVTSNVVSFAMSVGASGMRRAAYIAYWELFNNEALHTPTGRCDANTGPVFDPEAQAGYWLIRPDGSRNYAWHYFEGLINGSIPVPVPPSPAVSM